MAGRRAPPPTSEPPIGLVLDVVHDAGDWGAIDAVSELAHAAAAAVAAELALAASEACLALSSRRARRRTQRDLSRQAGADQRAVVSRRREAPAVRRRTPRSLGDVVLAAETVAREARDLGLPLAHHMQHLIVHGLLHLLGFDHETEAEARTMEALEVRILAGLAIADPYAGADAAPSSCRNQTELLKS